MGGAIRLLELDLDKVGSEFKKLNVFWFPPPAVGPTRGDTTGEGGTSTCITRAMNKKAILSVSKCRLDRSLDEIPGRFFYLIVRGIACNRMRCLLILELLLGRQWLKES